MNYNFFWDFPFELVTAGWGEFVILAIILVSLLGVLTFFIADHYKGPVLVSIVCSIFIAKVLCIIVNETFHVFPRKPAGNFILWMSYYHQEYGIVDIFQGRVYKNFLVQYLINLPIIELFGRSRGVVILVNAFFTSLIGILSYGMLRNVLDRKGLIFIVIVLSLYPAGFNFSLYGLRDPLIFFFVSLNIVALFKIVQNISPNSVISLVISFVALFSLRPETLAFVMIPYAAVFISYLAQFYKRHGKLNQKILLVGMFILGILLPGVFLFFNFYDFIAGQINAEGVSPIEIIDTYSVNRYNRHESGSSILPPDMYRSLHWFPRWLLQSSGIIILPFPWLIVSIAKLLAFTDSILMFYLLYRYLRIKNYLKRIDLDFRRAKQRKFAKILFYTFFCGVFIMGTLVNNAGNAFRMRMAIFPFLALSVGIMYSIYYEQQKKIRINRNHNQY